MTSARGWVVENTFPRYLETGTGNKMRTEVVLKDAESMLQLGNEYSVPLPMHTVTHAYYEWAQTLGLKDRPWDETIKVWESIIGKPIRF